MPTFSTVLSRRILRLGTMAAVITVAGYGLLAQTPATPPAPADGAAAAPAQGRGAGGRGVLPPDPAAGRGASSVQRDSPANANADFSPKPPVTVKTPADEQKLFQLQSGFHIENVLADPYIQEPAAIAFDGNGRMYVTELRTYMNDADGTDTLTVGGRISRHEDRDNDGVYEIHTVFVDNMIFPRFAMPFGADAILAKNSNDPDVWKYTDTNGDGVADKKELFATDFGRGGNVEHQESHLTWGMDNWLYSTYNAVRLRWTPRGVLRESSGSGGAWGVTQDNEGKIWLQGGASGLPGYYQLPVRYGNFTGQNQMDPELRTTWGAPVRRRKPVKASPTSGTTTRTPSSSGRPIRSSARSIRPPRRTARCTSWTSTAGSSRSRSGRRRGRTCARRSSSTSSTR
jgi:hypothetical protein